MRWVAPSQRASEEALWRPARFAETSTTRRSRWFAGTRRARSTASSARSTRWRLRATTADRPRGGGGRQHLLLRALRGGERGHHARGPSLARSVRVSRRRAGARSRSRSRREPARKSRVRAIGDPKRCEVACLLAWAGTESRLGADFVWARDEVPSGALLTCRDLRAESSPHIAGIGGPR